MSKEFDNTLTQAAKAKRKLDAEEARRVSAKGLLAASLKQAGSTEQKVQALAKQLAVNPALERSRTWVRRAVQSLLAFRYSSPLDPARFDAFGADVAGEIAAAGGNVGELFCVAVIQAAERDPDRFGDVDNPTQHAQAVRTLREKYLSLCAKLESSWQRDDVVIEPAPSETLRNEGYCRVGFKRTGGVVPVYGDDTGARLVDWVVANSPRRAA